MPLSCSSIWPEQSSGLSHIIHPPRYQAPSAAHQPEAATVEPAAAPQESGTSQEASEIPWQSINAGGGRAAGTSYELNCSIGQPAVGVSSSDNHQVGIGYWWGVFTASGACACPNQSDFDRDGFLTALDLSEMIDILFAGHPDVQDLVCPSPRADFDCDGFSTALDLSGLIDHLFAGAVGPCDPCTP